MLRRRRVRLGRYLLFSAYAMVVACVAYSAEVADVVAKQRYPWNGLVAITCRVTGNNEIACEAQRQASCLPYQMDNFEKGQVK